MKHFSWIFFISVILSLGDAKLSYGPPRVGRLEIVERQVRPGQNSISDIFVDILAGPEIWVFRTRQDFAQIVEESGLGDYEMERLYDENTQPLTFNDVVRYEMAIPLPADSERFKVSPLLKMQMPQAFLQKLHEYQIRNQLAPYYVPYDSREDFEEAIEGSGLAPEAENFLKEKRLFLIDGKYYLFLTPEVMGHAKRFVGDIFQSFLGNLSYSGLALDLVYDRSDDLNQIAGRYAGDRDPKIIKRYLEMKLAEAGGASARIPLQNLLTPFIRRFIDKYTGCIGANCYNATLAANSGREYVMEHVFIEDYLNTLFQGYRIIGSGEELRLGDVLVLLNVHNTPVHGAIYVDEDVIFTKNGMSAFRPYVFQKISETAAIYFSGPEYRVAAFRKALPGEKSAGELYPHRSFLSIPLIYDGSKISREDRKAHESRAHSPLTECLLKSMKM